MRLFFILLFISNFSAQAQDSTQVREISDSCIFVRNITGAGFNSVSCLDTEFRVYMGCPINHFSITIYDRWSTQLFFSNDIEAFWRADYCADGLYIWHVKGEMLENGALFAVEKTGYVMVLD